MRMLLLTFLAVAACATPKMVVPEGCDASPVPPRGYQGVQTVPPGEDPETGKYCGCAADCGDGPFVSSVDLATCMFPPPECSTRVVVCVDNSI